MLQSNDRQIALSISPFRDDHHFLRSVLGRISEVRTCHEACALLSKTRMGVIVCERDLPDGSWKDVLNQIARIPDSPCLVVTSRLADDLLWAEVLNLGGYDVLAKPFDKEEVRRVLALAIQQWRSRRSHKTPFYARVGAA